jgi:pyridoxamine 5'-phosphate oxidase
VTDETMRAPTHRLRRRVPGLAAMRHSYELGGLDEADLAGDWLAQLRSWLAAAEDAGVLEPNAMIVSTATPDGAPSARTVLLKGLDERGLVFFTGYDSRKGTELQANPRASIVFPWIELQRQVLIAGDVERVADEDADAYWANRPRGSQLGALASPQSQRIDSRAVLEEARDRLAAEYPDVVPRPARWGGFRVVPEAVEFWQGRADRLHDRLRYRKEGGNWLIERLAP